MITDKDEVKSLAGKTWNEVKQGTDKILNDHLHTLPIRPLLDPTFDFCSYIAGLIHSMETHEYPVTTEQALMWLYVAAHQCHVKYPHCGTAYKQFVGMLVPADYDPLKGAIARSRLYDLFNSKCLVTPTHGTVLWNSFLQTGTEKRAKPNLSTWMVFPWLYKVMPVWYRKDIAPTENFIREAIFMVLPCLLGKFSQSRQTDKQTT